MAKFYMRLCLKRADKFVEPVDYEVGLVCECVAWVGCRQGDDRGPCRTPCLETRIRVFEDHALPWVYAEGLSAFDIRVGVGLGVLDFRVGYHKP